jgi:hypothetical protein
MRRLRVMEGLYRSRGEATRPRRHTPNVSRDERWPEITLPNRDGGAALPGTAL